MTGEIKGFSYISPSEEKPHKSKKTIGSVKKAEVDHSVVTTLKELEGGQAAQPASHSETTLTPLTAKIIMPEDDFNYLIDDCVDIELNPKTLKRAEKAGKKAIKQMEKELKSVGIAEKDIKRVAKFQVQAHLTELDDAIKQGLLDQTFNKFIEELLKIEKLLSRIDQLAPASIPKESQDSKFEIEFKDREGSVILLSAPTKEGLKEKLSKIMMESSLKTLNLEDENEFKKFIKQLNKTEKTPFFTPVAISLISEKSKIFQNMLKKLKGTISKTSPTSSGVGSLEYIPNVINSSMLIAAIGGIIGIKKAFSLRNRAIEIYKKANLLQLEGKAEEAEIVRKEADKMIRISLGLYSVSSIEFLGGLSISTSGIFGFCEAFTEIFIPSTTFLSIIGGGTGALAGTLMLSLSARNIRKNYLKKETISAIEDEIVQDYARWPGTEEEVKVALQICEKFKSELSAKIGVNSIRASSSASIIGASGCSIAAIAGISTAGIGTIVLAGAALTTATGGIGYKKIKKHKNKNEERQLAEEGKFTETKTGLIATIHHILKSEERSEILAGNDKNPSQIFSDRIVPILFGVSREIFLKTTKTTADLFAEDIQNERVQITIDLKERMEADVGSDPVWDKRIKRHLSGEGVGKLYRTGGIKELSEELKIEKTIDSINTEIFKIGKEIKKLEEQITELKKKENSEKTTKKSKIMFKKIDSFLTLQRELKLTREKLSAIKNSKESEIQSEHKKIIESLKSK